MIGQRPPSASLTTCAPISSNGSSTRRIGRLRSDASPSKVASIPWPPTTPIISREPVPALPKSSGGARRENRADAEAVDAPAPFSDPLDAGAERAAGFAGAQHVVAFEQAVDHGFAAAEQAKNEGAMRDRLVAGRADAASERAAAFGAERLDGGRRGSRHSADKTCLAGRLAGLGLGS